MILKFLILLLNLNMLDSFFLQNNFFTRFNNYFVEMNDDSYHQEYLNYLIEYKNLDINTNSVKNNLLFFEKNSDIISDEKFKIFRENYKFIEDMNEKLENNDNNLKLGMNEFFDEIPFYDTSRNLMNEVIPKNFSNELNLDFVKKYKSKPFNLFKSIINYKNTINWNNTEYLSPVKNQLSCGSCWAFSATSALESHMRINNYSVDRLSEQELVDCSKENFGCNGGWMHRAFDFIIKNNGLYSNNDYEYNATTNSCRYKIKEDLEKKCSNNENCSKCNNCIFFNNELFNNNTLPDDAVKVLGSNLKDYEFTIPQSVIDISISLQNGPICIAIDASSFYFQFYKEGVIDIPSNHSQNLNHAVLLVGIDKDENGLHWIIQNSWGSKWGDNGFARIRAIDGDGVLLSNLYGVYPTKI